MGGKKGSTNQRKKKARGDAKERKAAAGRGAGRFDSYGENYEVVTFADLKTRIPGFGTLQNGYHESTSKFEKGTTTGWLVVMDLSKTYYRILNPQGEYTGSDGTPKRGGADPESDDDFLARSHFSVA